MDDIISTEARPEVIDVREEIIALASAHGVVYQVTDLDRLGDAITRLAGDDVELDGPARLLIALRRGGHITSAEAARLHGRYLRAKYE